MKVISTAKKSWFLSFFVYKWMQINTRTQCGLNSTEIGRICVIRNTCLSFAVGCVDMSVDFSFNMFMSGRLRSQMKRSYRRNTWQSIESCILSANLLWRSHPWRFKKSKQGGWVGGWWWEDQGEETGKERWRNFVPADKLFNCCNQELFLAHAVRK